MTFSSTFPFVSTVFRALLEWSTWSKSKWQCWRKKFNPLPPLYKVVYLKYIQFPRCFQVRMFNCLSSGFHITTVTYNKKIKCQQRRPMTTKDDSKAAGQWTMDNDLRWCCPIWSKVVPKSRWSQMVLYSTRCCKILSYISFYNSAQSFRDAVKNVLGDFAR